MALDKKSKKGILFALGGFSLFSIGDVFIKFLADEGFNAVEIAFFLNLCFLPYLLILSPVIGGIKATLRTEKLWLHILSALFMVLIFLANVNAFGKLGLNLTYTLIFAAPFFTTILSAIFLKQKIHSHRWIGVIAGFIGVLIVLRPGIEPLDIAAYAVLFGAVLIAANNLIIRIIGEHEPLMAFSLFNCVVGLQVFGVLCFFDGEANIPQGKDWLYLMIIAAFHVGGRLMTARAFSIADTPVVAPFHYIQILWGTMFGIVIFSNVPDIWTGLGALVIVSSGIYLIYREHVRNQHITAGLTAHGTVDQEQNDFPQKPL